MSSNTFFRNMSLVAVGIAALGVGVAHAQDKFPSKPITLIVPWSAGGGSDTSMRLLAAAATKYLGQTVVVENNQAPAAPRERELSPARSRTDIRSVWWGPAWSLANMVIRMPIS